MLERKNIGRLGVVVVILSAVILLILWRYISLMLLTPEQRRAPDRDLIVERGPILDRSGRVLAIQTKLESVTAWVPDIESPKETSELLATSLDLDDSNIRSILTDRPGFAYIKRKITQIESETIRSLIDQDKLPGIRLIEESARTYPEQRTAAPILGIVDIDNRGIEGLELEYDSVLFPTPDDRSEGEIYGNQIFLTLDLNLQYSAEQIAERVRLEQQADSVMILAMDSTNGDLLVVAGTPSFNPNTYQSFPIESRLNQPVMSAYEPGSVFKVFSVAAILSLGISPLRSFFCNGFYENSDLPEPISCLGVHGEVDFNEIIIYSCNAGAAYASELVEAESFYHVIRKFGFGSETALPFPGESNGLLESPDNWSTRTKPTMAFGQEISTSAVQIVAAATAFTNQGVRLEPHIIKRVVGPDGRVTASNDRTEVEAVIPAETARAILFMMEEATHLGGTATRASVEGIRVSAKTGTAQVFTTETGSYSDERFVASCLAIFPTDDPQIILYVVIRNPQAGETYGGRIAAPVVAEFGNELVSYLGIPRAGDLVITHSGEVTLPTRPDITIGEEMPDLTGYSKRELLPLLDLDSIQVTIRGEGWVVEQDPPIGTPITAGTSVVLDLE